MPGRCSSMAAGAAILTGFYFRVGDTMAIGSPASRGYFRIRFSPFDTAWAIASPVMALAVRDAYVFSYEGLLYCSICVAFSLMAFSAFRLHDGVSRFFSVSDAGDVLRAVAAAELMTCILLFTFTRLDNIPRSVPIVHAFTLCAGLIAVRALARLREDNRGIGFRQRSVAVEHIIMVGSTNLTFWFVKFLAAYCPGQKQVIAVLDGRLEMIGRTVCGIRIVGPPGHLQAIIDEFAEHGIQTGRVVVGGDSNLLPVATLGDIRRLCKQRRIPLDFVPELMGLSALEVQGASELDTIANTAPPVKLSPYFRWKYAIDFVIAAIAVVLSAPFLVVAGGFALVDVGSPIMFWQQRLGEGGRTFTIYKIRTLRPPFDQRGRPVPENRRLSWVGALLRRTRLDELPQLFNVLVGDMSLIGPRPLLPRDQPSDPSVRLMSRPGITGWAQVNGGTLLTPGEKDKLDEWYVRRASFLLDLRIIMMTLRVLICGQSRPDCAAANARSTRDLSREPSILGAQPAIKAEIDRTRDRAGAAAAL
jgi:lipopolysaccharide/colanic/teichoic acid biosynthesis glycosyltransferase